MISAKDKAERDLKSMKLKALDHTNEITRLKKDHKEASEKMDTELTETKRKLGVTERALTEAGNARDAAEAE